jgi:hypothetical protein
MKVQITQTLTRTIVIDVAATTDQDAIERAVNALGDTEAADWTYTWEPISQEAHVVHN